MRIIGIRIYNGDDRGQNSPTEVMRGVKAGWFPFGNYPEPSISDGEWTIENDILDNGLYNVFARHPHISVVGIVGKNGSGKSSLLDYFIRIVNNAACQLLYDQYASDEQQPVYAYGLFADLYFETDDIIRLLKCRNEQMTYSVGIEDVELANLDQWKRYEIASCLFYIVMCNYGSYSLNASDYLSDTQVEGLKGKVNGNWLKQIFQLEQNYIFPLTITPIRFGGNIDVNKLKEESVEKLVSLMLFAKTRGYQFMPGYKLSKIEFTLMPHAREQFTGKIEMTASGKHVGIEDLAIMAASMAEGWAKKLGCEEQYLSDVDDQERNGPLEVFKLLIEYMGYQTVHLCTYYDKFRNLFDVIKYVREHIRQNVPYEQGFIEDIDEYGLYNAIQQDHTNVTYGIRKCISTVAAVLKNGIDGSPFLKTSGEMDFSNVNLKAEISLDEILMKLPSPLYQLDAKLIKDEGGNEIQLSKMSSGEKQFLYSLAATIFHIKSMDESIAAGKGIGFRHICLVFDEAELYYHPEFQQNFIYNLLHYLSWLRLQRIASIQIVIATHSPFILSDIPKDNILFMRNGLDYKTTMSEDEEMEFKAFSTFGANYYDLLRNGFFLKEQPVGKFAATKIEELMIRIKQGRIDDTLREQVSLVADPVIRGYLLYEMEKGRRNGYVQN